MLTEHEARALLERYDLHPDIVRHCLGVGRVAHELAEHILRRNPDAPIDLGRVRAAAILHDIGRREPANHERRTLEILRAEGLDELAELGIHGTVYEEHLLMHGEEDPELLPRTLEQKIVCYADLRFAQRAMTLRERIEDAIVRKRHLPGVEAIIRASEERLFVLEAELLALADFSSDTLLGVETD